MSESVSVLYLGALQAAWLLVPMIPAILIFRIFHDTAVRITGPLLGVTVSASGAFAGYLVIVLLSQSWVKDSQGIVHSWMPPPHWVVTTEIKLLEANGQSFSHPDLMPKVSIYEDPEWVHINPFTQTATINVVEGNSGLPRIFILVPGYGSKIIEPETLAANKTDPIKKLIKLKSIEFKKDFSPTTNQVAPAEPIGTAQ